MIAVDDQLTAGTMIASLTQGHHLPMVAPATILGRIGRIDSYIMPASFFRFAGQFAEKSRPRGIMNAFRQTMIVGHTVHLQVFDADDPIRVDDLAAFLVGEVLPPELHTFMDSCHRFTVLMALGCTLCQFAVLALYTSQSLLFFAKEARVGDLFTAGERGKRFESYINAHLGRHIGQAKRFTLHRERSVPLACTAFLDGECFDLSTDGSVPDDFEMPDARKGKLALLVDLETELRIGEAIIASLALETGIAGGLTRFDSAEEGFHGKIKPNGYILQDLGVDFCEGRTFLFQ